MIREKFNIDNKLLISFLKNNKFDSVIEEDLLEWYAFLDDKDYEKGRRRAINFIKKIASESLLEINFPEEEKEGLLDVFNPLESLLRTAHSLHNTSKNIKVRDHLSHTIRNLLFANYLLKFYHNNSLAHLKRKLNTAVIFHDIGYPIEKLKKIGNNLKDATFSDLLNSSGKVDFILSKPDDLLDMLNHWGKLSNSTDLPGNKESKTRIQNKINHLYKEILTPAIAGQGLFDSNHNLSSVVLFLRPIIKHWIKSQKYVQMKIENICDICFAIAYHDRKLPIANFDKYNTEIPILVKILRIADEMQEWDRVKSEDSFIKDVEIDFLKNYLSVKFIMKHSKLVKCNPNYFIPDKIIGLTPVVGKDKVILSMVYPEEIEIKEKEEINNTDKETTNIFFIEKKSMTDLIKSYTKNKKSKKVVIEFHDNNVKIELV